MTTSFCSYHGPIIGGVGEKCPDCNNTLHPLPNPMSNIPREEGERLSKKVYTRYEGERLIDGWGEDGELADYARQLREENRVLSNEVEDLRGCTDAYHERMAKAIKVLSDD